jgi:hypothetical protein
MSASETIVNPDFDRSNQGTLQGLIAQALNNFKKNLDNCLPATVISYDRTKNVASLQPQIQMLAVDGTLVNRASIASAPVFAMGGGGFLINFPLVSGSKGWIKANDRDISLYLQSGNTTAPGSGIMHSFSNGVFYPDFGSNFTIAGEDNASAVIQNQAGTIKISFWPNKVKITAGSNTFEVNETDIIAKVGSNTLDLNATQLTATVGSLIFQMSGAIIGLTGEVDVIGGPLRVNGVPVTVP